MYQSQVSKQIFCLFSSSTLLFSVSILKFICNKTMQTIMYQAQASRQIFCVLCIITLLCSVSMLKFICSKTIQIKMYQPQGSKQIFCTINANRFKFISCIDKLCMEININVVILQVYCKMDVDICKTHVIRLWVSNLFH